MHCRGNQHDNEQGLDLLSLIVSDTSLMLMLFDLFSCWEFVLHPIGQGKAAEGLFLVLVHPADKE